MKSEQLEIKQLSDTYQNIYKKVIGPLITHILTEKKHYCVRNRQIVYEIGNKYIEYKKSTTRNMTGDRLDRHKLSSCICGAIIETKPLTGCNGYKIAGNTNEILGLFAGLSILKYYMVYDFLKELGITGEKLKVTHNYIMGNFSMELPSVDENICDIQIYQTNLLNALTWTHHECVYKQSECFHYDIWAYATVFYHLEVYNKSFLEKFYDEYIKGQEK